jgi:hypothetical protein
MVIAGLIAFPENLTLTQRENPKVLDRVINPAITIAGSPVSLQQPQNASVRRTVGLV